MILVSEWWKIRQSKTRQRDGRFAQHACMHQLQCLLAESQLACFGCTLGVSTMAGKGSCEEQFQKTLTLTGCDLGSRANLIEHFEQHVSRKIDSDSKKSLSSSAFLVECIFGTRTNLMEVKTCSRKA